MPESGAAFAKLHYEKKNRKYATAHWSRAEKVLFLYHWLGIPLLLVNCILELQARVSQGNEHFFYWL